MDTKAYSILIIEDNLGDFTLIEDYLLEQILAPSIERAHNYSEASTMLSKGTCYDVVFLDLSLPDKSGESLIEEIILSCPETPVIVLTGYADMYFGIRSLSLGAADYLLKEDMNPTVLYKSIIYNIERKRTSMKLIESEKRYSDLFNLSPQPMWLYEPGTLKFVEVNNAAIEQYGYSRNEFLDMTIMDIRPEEDHVKLKDFLGSKEKGDQVFKGLFRHLKKSMEVIEVEIFSNPILIYNKLYSSVIAIDVTERTLFDHRITKAIIKTQEDERYEIGSELHDNVCQLLATTQVSLSMLKKSLKPDAVQWYDRSKEYIVLATEEIRNLSHRLAPAFFDDTTLKEAFDKLLHAFNIEKKYSIALHFNTAAKEHALGRDIQLNLYRILQEQLRNIMKYAKATSVEVEVAVEDEQLEMLIADNGIGFDVEKAKGGIGLANMRRRTELFSGHIDIESSIGKGCTITVNIPLKDQLH